MIVEIKSFLMFVMVDLFNNNNNKNINNKKKIQEINAYKMRYIKLQSMRVTSITINVAK